ncbi:MULTISPECIES: NAD(P)/FAD-dependent oxidoreductase [Brucella/Ochrobactrum group]|jgi:sarcosine oxidase subunit beta|uniref:FAD-binding oxidoreductase n=1 Tax=Brucella pseudintermedia TaxID=370111 RepID=A0ABY5UDP0_9HYPH|nr:MULTISPECIES: FAD-binding oxidoreductase [Brucella/Ochrobactrum group]KAB2682885.1 FAD-binding oxidoreductase [Brucella pseudintermedia]MCO7728216.1 FAD-binding oxidoreductase [Brucella intermedia]NKE74269.1 FAD-binding oxidoreductase [Ochrobactrum sp. MC-1LL]TWH03435.1 sarcosine oxidase subunit beta [Ochrobactrum sp. J50]UWL61451.1 FAD-binding oxidoreductase [Brucella pseudintermedia]
MTRRLQVDAVIIGGGIVGGSAALFMRRAGLSVILLDKGFCGAQASGVNYGGVRRQGRAPEQLPLAQRSHALWARLPELIGIDGEYIRSGHLKLARTEEHFARLEAYAATVRPLGLDVELIGGNAIRERFPWLPGDVAGASLCAEDGHANPRLVAPAFARAALAAGATVLENTPVIEARETGDGFAILAGDGVEIRSRLLFNCAGAWSDRFAASFGEPVPLQRIYPSMVVTEPMPFRLPMSLGEEGGGFYGRQVTRGNYVMGGGRGTPLENPDFSRPSVNAASSVMLRAIELFPHLKNAQVIRFWSGTESEMPDDNPVIGPSSRVNNLFHAFGFCGAGFQTGPAVGAILCDLAVRGETETPIDAFRIDRFDMNSNHKGE